MFGFVVALTEVGFKYWPLSGGQVSMPSALLGPGLAAVTVTALLLRALGTAQFWKIWLAIVTGLGFGASLTGTLVGSLPLLRSSQLD